MNGDPTIEAVLTFEWQTLAFLGKVENIDGTKVATFVRMEWNQLT